MIKDHKLSCLEKIRTIFSHSFGGKEPQIRVPAGHVPSRDTGWWWGRVICSLLILASAGCWPSMVFLGLWLHRCWTCLCLYIISFVCVKLALCLSLVIAWSSHLRNFNLIAIYKDLPPTTGHHISLGAIVGLPQPWMVSACSCGQLLNLHLKHLTSRIFASVWFLMDSLPQAFLFSYDLYHMIFHMFFIPLFLWYL